MLMQQGEEHPKINTTQMTMRKNIMTDHKLLATASILLGLLVSTVPAPAEETCFWVGEKIDLQPIYTGITAFGYDNNWLPAHPETPYDTAVFDPYFPHSGNDYPTYIYFGDAELAFMTTGGTDYTFVPAFNGQNAAAIVTDGEWTFDFSAFNSPGGDTGSYDILYQLCVGTRTSGNQYGNATLRVCGNGQLNSWFQTTLGASEGTFGRLAISSPLTSFNAGMVTVGQSGYGDLLIENGATAECFDILLGASPTSMGGLSVVDDATLFCQERIDVGNSGFGEMEIRYAEVTSDHGMIGNFRSSMGNVTIDNGGIWNIFQAWLLETPAMGNSHSFAVEVWCWRIRP